MPETTFGNGLDSLPEKAEGNSLQRSPIAPNAESPLGEAKAEPHSTLEEPSEGSLGSVDVQPTRSGSSEAVSSADAASREISSGSSGANQVERSALDTAERTGVKLESADALIGAENEGVESASPASASKARSSGSEEKTVDSGKRKVLIGSQRDAAQFRPKPLGEGIKIVLPEQTLAGKQAKDEPVQPTDRDLEIRGRGAPSREQSRTPAITEGSPTGFRDSLKTGQGAPPGFRSGAGESEPSREDISPASSRLGQPAAASGAPPSVQDTSRDEVFVKKEPPKEPEWADVGVGERADSFGDYSSDNELTGIGGETPAELMDLPAGFSAPAPGPPGVFPPPKRQPRLPAELETELEAAMSGMAMEDLLTTAEPVTRQELIPPETLCEGQVVLIRGDTVFLNLGAREEGMLTLKETDPRPELGAKLKVRVVRFVPEDSLYELAFPAGAADVAAWEDLVVGTIVEARVTGVNPGGLECEVNHIRGFIPASHVGIYRVTNLEEYVGQRLPCVVLEADRPRRKLVLSRRAVLQRELEAQREALWASLEAGQVREGLVRRLTDYGAFVDLGGVDGLLHITQISWGRVNHPSEVLQEGQAIKVKVLSVDKEARRVSLAYRDLFGNPWEQVAVKYPQNSQVRGRVTRLEPYGAFVELEPGVEGLVHISELSHRRISRPSEVVKEGQEIEALVLSVDPATRRISLSMKQLIAPVIMPPIEELEAQRTSSMEVVEEQTQTSVEPETVPMNETAPHAQKAPAASEAPEKGKKPERTSRSELSKSKEQLKGGLGRSPRGKKFGLR